MDREKILIVDDDENIAELISLYLNKECYETQIASDGASALEAFIEFAPNLILLDVMLPGMDGYQVCTEIRKQSNVPIIMLSAKGEVFDKVLGLKIGADDYIVKPFDSNELVARVGAARRCNTREDSSKNYDPTNADHIGTYVEYDNLVVNISNYTVTLEGKKSRNAAKRTGTAVFPCQSSKSGVYKRTTAGQVMGGMNMSAIPERSTSISNVCVKN